MKGCYTFTVFCLQLMQKLSGLSPGKPGEARMRMSNIETAARYDSLYLQGQVCRPMTGLTSAAAWLRCLERVLHPLSKAYHVTGKRPEGATFPSSTSGTAAAPSPGNQAAAWHPVELCSTLSCPACKLTYKDGFRCSCRYVKPPPCRHPASLVSMAPTRGETWSSDTSSGPPCTCYIIQSRLAAR